MGSNSKVTYFIPRILVGILECAFYLYLQFTDVSGELAQELLKKLQISGSFNVSGYSGNIREIAAVCVFCVQAPTESPTS